MNKETDAEKVQEEKKATGIKAAFNAALDYLSGSLTPIIPILLVASLCKMIAAVIGPSLLGIVSETTDIYNLFNMVGTAGFCKYFLQLRDIIRHP